MPCVYGENFRHIFFKFSDLYSCVRELKVSSYHTAQWRKNEYCQARNSNVYVAKSHCALNIFSYFHCIESTVEITGFSQATLVKTFFEGLCKKKDEFSCCKRSLSQLNFIRSCTGACAGCKSIKAL